MFSSVLYYYYYSFFFHSFIVCLFSGWTYFSLLSILLRILYTLKRYRSDIMFMKWKFNSSFLHGLSKEWKTSFQRSSRCKRNERFSNVEIVTLMVEVEDDEFKCLYKQIYIEATLNTFSELCFHNFQFFFARCFVAITYYYVHYLYHRLWSEMRNRMKRKSQQFNSKSELLIRKHTNFKKTSCCSMFALLIQLLYCKMLRIFWIKKQKK